MKYIKSRDRFLNEAKIKDVIFSQQAKKVKEMWGEKYLDYEEIIPTEHIKQGKWKLTEEDKNKVLGAFFDADMDEVFDLFSKIPDKFAEMLLKSIDLKLIRDAQREKYEAVLKDFNIKKPSIDQIVNMYNNIFRKLSVNETRADEIISKDENGRPIRDEENNIVKISKVAGDPVFSNNLVNINGFIEDYNRCYPDDRIISTTFQNDNITSIRNLAMEDCNGEYKVDFAIFNKDIYLSISHNPKDILNMSISKFYSSCQHLYSGGYNSQVLGNVFDPNSIPAFLTFDTPIFLDGEKISDQLPLSRMVIRHIESFEDELDKSPKIFFDRAYPDRVKEIFDDMVIKYSGNIENTEDAENTETYLFSPDVDYSDNDSELSEPYMDRLGIRRGTYIGVNTKKLYLSRISDWRGYKISKNAKIKELIIETTDIPDNLLDMKLDLDWIKFKFLKLTTLKAFDKIKSNAIAFDKCTFDNSILNEIKETNPGIEKIQLTACDITGLDLSILGSLNELQLVYTLEKGIKLKDVMNGITIKKLVISGDTLADRENKIFINSLKSKGVKVETIGPVL